MNRISELRKKLGLTQTRLGEEIGVSQQTISKYEKVDENISGDMLLAFVDGNFRWQYKDFVACL